MLFDIDSFPDEPAKISQSKNGFFTTEYNINNQLTEELWRLQYLP